MYMHKYIHIYITSMHLGETYLTAITLRNMHVTTNGSNTSNYLSLRPASFVSFIPTSPR
jgi:hypothetical protein